MPSPGISETRTDFYSSPDTFVFSRPMAGQRDTFLMKAHSKRAISRIFWSSQQSCSKPTPSEALLPHTLLPHSLMCMKRCCNQPSLMVRFVALLLLKICLTYLGFSFLHAPLRDISVIYTAPGTCRATADHKFLQYCTNCAAPALSVVRHLSLNRADKYIARAAARHDKVHPPSCFQAPTSHCRCCHAPSLSLCSCKYACVAFDLPFSSH
jgi:hypothetical protein